jgi:hypothetical protein
MRQKSSVYFRISRDFSKSKLPVHVGAACTKVQEQRPSLNIIQKSVPLCGIVHRQRDGSVILKDAMITGTNRFVVYRTVGYRQYQVIYNDVKIAWVQCTGTR